MRVKMFAMQYVDKVENFIFTEISIKWKDKQNVEDLKKFKCDERKILSILVNILFNDAKFNKRLEKWMRYWCRKFEIH